MIIYNNIFHVIITLYRTKQRIHLCFKTTAELSLSFCVSTELFVLVNPRQTQLVHSEGMSTCLYYTRVSVQIKRIKKNYPNKRNWLSSFYHFTLIYFLFGPWWLVTCHHAISHLKLMHDVILWHQSVQTNHRISIFYILFCISIYDEHGLVFSPIMRQYFALYKLYLVNSQIEICTGRRIFGYLSQSKC